jgi:uncharacterized DUF497 family protein
MRFEWDEDKNKLNIKKHGFALPDGIYVFADAQRYDDIDKRRDYGEERHLVVGGIGDDILAVVYTHRQNIIRLISVRYASRKERRGYYGND